MFTLEISYTIDFFFKFDWDAETQSTVLGCFFYGYVLTQIPGGRMAEIFGGKWIFGCGILLTSIFTVLMPWAAKADFRLLIAVRVIDGLGEGIFYIIYLGIQKILFVNILFIYLFVNFRCHYTSNACYVS